MTTIEKAKAYDEALEKMREFMLRNPHNDVIQKNIKNAFPELKESEDERMRKAIKYYLQNTITCSYPGISQKDCIAYLERQKEVIATPQDWNDYKDKPVEVWNAYLKGKANGIEIGKRIERQKEHESRVDACGFPLRENEESACSYLERCLAPDMRHVWYEACAEIKEKQKEQQPAKWSEEDKSMLLNVKCAIDEIVHSDFSHTLDYPIEHYENLWNWLDELWFRVAFLAPHWKPSEEQMRVLSKFNDPVVKSLYNDLKNL